MFMSTTPRPRALSSSPCCTRFGKSGRAVPANQKSQTYHAGSAGCQAVYDDDLDMRGWRYGFAKESSLRLRMISGKSLGVIDLPSNVAAHYLCFLLASYFLVAPGRMRYAIDGHDKTITYTTVIPLNWIARFKPDIDVTIAIDFTDQGYEDGMRPLRNWKYLVMLALGFNSPSQLHHDYMSLVIQHTEFSSTTRASPIMV